MWNAIFVLLLSPALADDGAAPADNTSTDAVVGTIDDAIKGSKKVKKCFAAEQKQTRKLPDVDVMLEVAPSGDFSSAKVTTAAFVGSALDGCLQKAILSLSVPAYQGDVIELNYPFKF